MHIIYIVFPCLHCCVLDVLELFCVNSVYLVDDLHLMTLVLIQVAIKNNIDVFYFACQVPMNALFVEDGQMDKRVFLATWKDIPAQNEVQYALANIQCNAGIDLNISQLVIS